MIKIAVPGVNGRMSAAVANQVLQAADLQLAVALVRADNHMLGKKLAKSNVIVRSSFADHDFDVLVDFTLPAGVISHLEYCVRHKKAMIIGTTGFSEQNLKIIEDAAKKIPIVLSANFSVGVNVCNKLLALAAKSFDKTWDISILDEHHKNKKDKPSGTAKHMAHILASNTGKDIKDINIYSEREGETVGTHTVTFANTDELLVISHIAESRNIFALGALAAARWVFDKEPGLYGMGDVI